MPAAFRVDRGLIGEGRVDHNGNLIVKGVLTRTGVFTYRHTDKNGKTYTTRELRHPDDVFTNDAIASFHQAPVTDDHPPEGRVTPENYKRYAVGNIGDSISREGPHDNLVTADLIIRDDSAINKALGRDGRPPKRYLSCGYKADVIPETGEYMGERYDHRQTNIRGNHVALVRNPRAGPVARLLIDADDAIINDGDEDQLDQRIADCEAIIALDALDKKNQTAVSEKIEKIAHEHPDWENDRVVAAAYSMLGLSRKKDREDVDKNADGGDGRVIGRTSTGKDINANHKANQGDDWTVEDHREAAYAARREHEKMRDTLATAQQIGLGDDAESKLKDGMKQLKAAHDYHKKEAMTLDSTLKADADGWMPEYTAPSQPQAGEDLVKIKRDAVTIGSGDEALHLDAVSITVDDDSEEALEQLLTRQDELIEFARTAHADAEQARGERDAALSQVNDPAKLDALVAERSAIMDVADFVGLKREDMKPLSNGDIKRKIVLKRDSTMINDESSDDYVQGCYNMIVRDSQKVTTNKGKFNALHDVAAPRRDAKDDKGVDKNGKQKGEDMEEEEEGTEKKDSMTYRQHALSQLHGVHGDSEEGLRKRGFAN